VNIISKKRRINLLIKQTTSERGNKSEQAVANALRKLKGVVEVEISEKYSLQDKRGIDLIACVSVRYHNENRFGILVPRKRIIKIPLQIKSSFYSATNFVHRNHSLANIPVLIYEPGACEQAIINAFGRIFDRFKNQENGIIEVAEFNTSQL